MTITVKQPYVRPHHLVVRTDSPILNSIMWKKAQIRNGAKVVSQSAEFYEGQRGDY